MRPVAVGGDGPGATGPGTAASSAIGSQRVTSDLVLAELHAHDFAVLSTADAAGQPHAAGVTYGVSPPGRALTLYVMTRRHLAKARDIALNPRVALVVPLPRRLLWFVPPATIQLRGRAEILDWTEPEGTEVFRRFWLGRRILAAYEQSRRHGETRVCFLRITPDPVVHTYGVGYSVWALRRRMEAAAVKVLLPTEHQAARSAAAGVAPTGNPVTARGIESLRIAAGRLAECWISRDGAALLPQGGAVRVPGRAAP